MKPMTAEQCATCAFKVAQRLRTAFAQGAKVWGRGKLRNLRSPLRGTRLRTLRRRGVGSEVEKDAKPAPVEVAQGLRGRGSGGRS